MHETNMFNPVPTGLKNFKAKELLFGSEIITARRGTNTETGGFIEGLEIAGIGIVPSVLTSATPGGVVSERAFNVFMDSVLDTLSTNTVDGILLCLHGAMVTEHSDDGEGLLLEKINKYTGGNIPVVITLDFHAVLTPEMAKYTNGIIIYRTYPHMDLSERGMEASILMNRILSGEINPVTAVVKQPLLIGPPHNVLPSDMPMKKVMDKARFYEQSNPSIIAACPSQGFMQQDVPYAGTGVAVTVDRDIELAIKTAEQLGRMMFDARHDFIIDLPEPAEAVEMALISKNYPVAIADSGDNIGGGTPGDGTALLQEILKQGVDSAFVQLCDPEAAKYASDSGIGSTITIDVGGKSSQVYGPPVSVTGKVRAITDGIYTNRSGKGYCAGVIDNMGLSARIDCGGLTLIVTSLPVSPNNLMHANSIGVYPEDYRITVCKGGLAFREAYKPPVTNSHIVCDTPGYSSSNLKNFNFKKIPRPIFPLDDI